MTFRKTFVCVMWHLSNVKLRHKMQTRGNRIKDGGEKGVKGWVK